MASVNKVILVGNLGKDPEVRYTQGGKAVASFQVATSEKWEKDGEAKEKVEWHHIVAFNKLAEVVEKWLKKGSQVYIEGKIQTRSWEDKEGVKRYTTEIIVNNLVMLGGKGGGGERRETAPGIPDDDVPF